jgi:predicted enzyme related to lactoylglutathione lyase
MLKGFPVMTQISVTDIDRAKEFYEKKLGLRPDGIGEKNAEIYTCGEGSKFLIYAGGAKPQAENTIMSFNVRQIEVIVNEMKSRGVVFEEYDLPGIKTENSIASKGDLKSAWFKDIDGNIIAVTQM